MGIPLVPEPIQTPEDENSRESESQIYEPGEREVVFRRTDDFAFFYYVPVNSTEYLRVLGLIRDSFSRAHSLSVPFEPGWVFRPHGNLAVDPSYTFWRDFRIHTRPRERNYTFAESLYSVLCGGLCSQNDEDMELKIDDDDDVYFSLPPELLNCGKERKSSLKKWFIHHIKDRPVFGLLKNAIVDLSYYSENFYCNKVVKWFLHHIKDRPVF